MEKLTHFNEKGQSRMVDVTQKDETIRIAVAAGKVLDENLDEGRNRKSPG